MSQLNHVSLACDLKKQLHGMLFHSLMTETQSQVITRHGLPWNRLELVSGSQSNIVVV